MSSSWTIHDALVLDSLGSAVSEGENLVGILSAVDYVNRLVLTHEEMEDTLRRLIGSELAVDSGLARFRRTRTADDVCQRCPSTSSLDRARWIRAYMGDFLDLRTDEKWVLSPADYRAALATYTKDMQRLLGRFTQGK